MSNCYFCFKIIGDISLNFCLKQKMCGYYMIIQKDLKRLFAQLLHDDFARITIDGAEVLVRIYDRAAKFSLVTPVYFGSNFIPNSVRQCVAKRAPFDHGEIKTFLTVDENNFQINLNYLGTTEPLSNQFFVELLEQFSWLAQEWRLYLDENDKNDLIHIRVK